MGAGLIGAVRGIPGMCGDVIIDPIGVKDQAAGISEERARMSRKPLFPAGSRTAADQMKLTPGIISGDHVFLTGMTGSGPDGTMPASVDDQFRQAFEKIGAVLQEAGLGFASIVEMTSYHVGMDDHFDRFCEIRSEYVSAPYPAWTAVEVAGLRRSGAVVEIRVVAATLAD
jgi:enamine deaminase RidA (YjgF/YER057c/UK114 family)